MLCTCPLHACKDFKSILLFKGHQIEEFNKLDFFLSNVVFVRRSISDYEQRAKKALAVCAFFILCVPKLRILLFKIFACASFLFHACAKPAKAALKALPGKGYAPK